MTRPSFTWTQFHSQLHTTIRQRHLFLKGERILVAVSGGQDSLCLIQLLLDLKTHWNWNLAIAHCDHGWRSDSPENARYVQGLAQSWGIPFHLLTASELLLSEAKARHWRYRSLAKLAQQEGYSCLATGHTASDRAETLLYNLARGSGADGLQALTWVRQLSDQIRLVRPLLGLTRNETAQFCQQFELSVWEDETNQDLRYARNWIRHELLPTLQENLNANAELHLAQTAEILRAEVEYLEAIAQTILAEATVSLDDVAGEAVDITDWLGALNRTVLSSEPLAIQRRVMRHWLQSQLSTTPSFEHIEKLVQLIAAPNQTQTDSLAGGAIAKVSHPWISLIQQF
jgi:tRNA(Ile)-lysidine synthase